MMPLLTHAADTFGGTLVNPGAHFRRVCIDSRQAQDGDLFVALKGENHDAHDFIPLVADKIAAAVVSHPDKHRPITQWVVPDTTQALGWLAQLRRTVFFGPVIAITGSSGKTSVKEFIAAILNLGGRTHATQDNYNNQIGLPLTVLSCPDDADYLVLEMGARASGDIDHLCTIARPDITLVNNIQSAHIASFGSLQGTASAKSEIYQNLPDEGTAVLNRDLPYFEAWREQIGKRHFLTFSMVHDDADLFADALEVDDHGCYCFVLRVGSRLENAGRWPVILTIPGRHTVANALAAAACAMAAGAQIWHVVTGLGALKPLAGRLQGRPLVSGSWLIDDTYNASPESVKAAVDVLVARKGRRVLVLGDMAELGADAQKMHCSVGDYARLAGVDELLTLGTMSAYASGIFGGKHFDTLDGLSRHLRDLEGSSVATFLVKGSRSAAMERVVKVLEQGVMPSC